MLKLLLAPGVYRLDVSVFSADGSRAGSASHVFRVNEPLITQATLIWDPNSETDLEADRTYYIAATAYNAAGAESGCSNEVIFRGSS